MDKKGKGMAQGVLKGEWAYLKGLHEKAERARNPMNTPLPAVEHDTDRLTDWNAVDRCKLMPVA